MKKDLVNFRGLYGENQTDSLADYIHIEELEVRSKLYDWEINEHLHTDLYQIFIFPEGEGLLISENTKIALNTPSILMIPPNTLHGFVFQSNMVGDVLTFSQSFAESIFKNSPHIVLEISRLKQFTFEESLEVFESLKQLKQQIATEFIAENPEKQLFMASLFQLLFMHLYRLSVAVEHQITKSDNRTLHYFQSFQKQIKQSFHESKSVTEYAKELNITAVHLNRVCQTLVQKSALQIIHEYMINEAQKYLLNTSYTIAEISYFLDFKDPAYFTRFFKKQTGFSPSEFRGRVLPNTLSEKL